MAGLLTLAMGIELDAGKLAWGGGLSMSNFLFDLVHAAIKTSAIQPFRILRVGLIMSIALLKKNAIFARAEKSTMPYCD
jgi:hypothetical protein